MDFWDFMFFRIMDFFKILDFKVFLKKVSFISISQNVTFLDKNPTNPTLIFSSYKIINEFLFNF